MSRGRSQLQLVAPIAVADDRTTVSVDPDATFRQYAPYVAAVAHRLLGRDHDVDDAVQDVFVIAMRGLAQLRDPQAIRGWLGSVAVRVSRRRLRWRRTRELLGFNEPWVYDNVASPSADPEQKALLSAVYQALDRLPVDDRIAWILHRIEGETLEATAGLSGCSLATTKRRIRRAAMAIAEAFDG